jgi:sigma-B regulation protein RsbU (phosphoserine phosphatase)
MTAKILIADDEPDLELLVTQRFRKQIREGEYAFLFARNGAEALELARGDRDIEVVLTDINMPVMDGLTLLGELAGLGRPLQPVIVSAYGDMANIRTAMNRGAFDFLTKPIDFHDFEITIAKTLRQVEEMKQAVQVRHQLAAVQVELNLARDIQQAILPQDVPLFPELDIQAVMVPARKVGGDFYDFFRLDEGRLGFILGDVSGKGIPAALFMVRCLTYLRAIVPHGLTPNECLQEVNAHLQQRNDAEMFVTLVYGILDTRTGRLQYSNAGHTPPYWLTQGEVRALDQVGSPMVGVFQDLSFAQGELSLRPGDGLVLYTDGVTEALDVRREQFSPERLESVLRQGNGWSAGTMVHGVVDAVRQFAGEAPQSDDIAVLAIRYQPGGHRSVM